MKKPFLLLAAIVLFLGVKISAQNNPLCFVNTLTVQSLNPSRVETADFNSDGNMDFAFASYNGNLVTVFQGNGTGSFAPTIYTLTTLNLLGLTSGDFNNDGKTDLATANHWTGAPEMTVLMNNGNGTFATPVNYTVGTPIPDYGRDICSGDFNHDGNTDLTILYDDQFAGGRIDLFLGNGTGIFSSATSYTIPNSRSIIKGRFNSDLYDDIAIADNNFTMIHILFGSASGIVPSITTYSMGALNMCTADFNNDGFADIANYEGLLLGSASGTFSPLYSYTVSVSGLAAADFDGDGNQDLALNQTLSSGLMVLKGLGNGYFGAPVTYTIDSQSISESASADFNNDNKPDLIIGSGITTITGSIFLNRTFSMTATASPTSLCAGSTVTMGVTGSAASYSWSTGATGSVIIVTPAAGTTYSVTGLNNGCSNTHTLFVDVIIPSVTATSNTTAICTGSSAILSATGANSYSWSTGATGSVVTVTPALSTTYSVTGFESGCSLTKTLSLLVNSLPVLTYTVERVAICAGASRTITVSGASSYTWDSGAQGNSVVVVPYTLFTATYAVTGTDLNGCKTTDTISENTAICDGIADYKSNKNALSLYPNPSAGIFYIDKTVTANAVVEIFNAAGELILTTKTDALNPLIDLSERPDGIYLVRCHNTDGETGFLKLVKQD